MTKLQRTRLGTVGKYALIAVYCAVFIFPIYFLVLLSFRSEADVFSRNPLALPRPATLEHYLAIFDPRGRNFYQFVFNSTVVGLATTVVALIVGGIASYSIVRFRFRGRSSVALGMLVLRMIPGMGVVIPLFTLLRLAGLLNTHFALIISYSTFSIPFVIWMLRGYIMEVPVALEECAMIDGCSRLGAMWRVTMPLVAPGLAATSIFCFLGSWNEFLLALVLTSTQDVQTIPIALTLSSTVTGQYGVAWVGVAAMTTTVSLPVVIFALLVQKHLIRGLTFGAVKG